MTSSKAELTPAPKSGGKAWMASPCGVSQHACHGMV